VVISPPSPRGEKKKGKEFAIKGQKKRRKKRRGKSKRK
jgi:hypothetical protein